MTSEQLRTARDANPFRPFTIHMADGRTWRIPHRDYLSMSPGGRIIHAFLSDDTWSILDLLLMTEIEFDKAPATGEDGTSNGEGP
jgi:hypothetical protein